jgi:hypothetical protein
MARACDLLLALLLAGCARATPTASPREVTVLATDFAYQMPDTLPAGLTTFHLVDQGHEPHHLMLYRLENGRTLANAVTQLEHDGPLPAWMHAAGGPNTPVPGGGEARATVRLAPGRYIAYCYIPSGDHVLHFAKGMIKPITVTGRPAAGAMPAADLSVTLTEYAFRFSAPPTRGAHTIAVINTGHDVHEMILSRLDPGRTPADFTHWIDAQDGPPPVTPYGGITDIAPGDTALIQVNFEPGTYSATCRVRAAADGRTHDLHGMSMGFTVQ